MLPASSSVSERCCNKCQSTLYYHYDKVCVGREASGVCKQGILTVFAAGLTSDSQPARWWFPFSWDVTLVESFIGFRDSAERHVGHGAAPEWEAVLVEVCGDTWGGRRCVCEAPQSHVVSLSHRNSWTLQDNKEPWEKRRLSATEEWKYAVTVFILWTHWSL